LDHSILGIALIQNNTLTYLNRRFAEIFGYSITEMREWPLEGFVILVHPEEKELMREHWREIQRGNMNGSITYPIRGITKSGAPMWLEVFLNQILLEGKPAILMQVMDISEKKANELLIQKLGSEIEVQNERLKQINEERDEYLEIIAHELRTPLTSILGFCECFLNESSCLTPSQMQYLEVITRNAQRLNRLVAHILGKSQLNHSKMELTLETFEVQPLVNQILEELSFQIRQKLPNIRISIPPKFKIEADKDKIYQVITNLLSNAIKYTPKWGTISIHCKKQGLTALFTIKDTGIGIRKEDLPYLFEKYANLSEAPDKSLGDVKGLGVGLFISKKLVELHAGRIWVESNGKNKGTAVHFEIPLPG
jgi:PAS domain S-box-containing protein